MPASNPVMASAATKVSNISDRALAAFIVSICWGCMSKSSDSNPGVGVEAGTHVVVQDIGVGSPLADGAPIDARVGNADARLADLETGSGDGRATDALTAKPPIPLPMPSDYVVSVLYSQPHAYHHMFFTNVDVALAAEDFRKIRAAGFDAVTLDASWGDLVHSVDLETQTFIVNDESLRRFKTLLREASGSGLGAIVIIDSDRSPIGISGKTQEVILSTVDAAGKPMPYAFGGNDEQSDPAQQAAFATYHGWVASQLRDHDVFLYWLDHEIYGLDQWGLARTVNLLAWRRYLQQRNSSLAHWNRRWGQSYESWDQVLLPLSIKLRDWLVATNNFPPTRGPYTIYRREPVVATERFIDRIEVREVGSERPLLVDDFADSTTDWWLSGGATQQPCNGARCLHLLGASVARKSLPVAAGQRLRVELTAFSPARSIASAELRLVWYAGNEEIGRCTTEHSFSALSRTAQAICTAPAGTTQARVSIVGAKQTKDKDLSMFVAERIRRPLLDAATKAMKAADSSVPIYYEPAPWVSPQAARDIEWAYLRDSATIDFAAVSGYWDPRGTTTLPHQIERALELARYTGKPITVSEGGIGATGLSESMRATAYPQLLEGYKEAGFRAFNVWIWRRHYAPGASEQTYGFLEVDGSALPALHSVVDWNASRRRSVLRCAAANLLRNGGFEYEGAMAMNLPLKQLITDPSTSNTGRRSVWVNSDLGVWQDVVVDASRPYVFSASARSDASTAVGGLMLQIAWKREGRVLERCSRQFTTRSKYRRYHVRCIPAPGAVVATISAAATTATGVRVDDLDLVCAE